MMLPLKKEAAMEKLIEMATRSKWRVTVQHKDHPADYVQDSHADDPVDAFRDTLEQFERRTARVARKARRFVIEEVHR